MCSVPAPVKDFYEGAYEELAACSSFIGEKGVDLKLERELTWSSMALHSKGKTVIPCCFLEFNIFLDKYIF